MVEERSLELADIELRYFVFESSVSNAETVVLLHGFPQDLVTWIPIAELLASRYRVLLPYQRGYFPTSAPVRVSKYSLSHLRSDVLSVIEKECTGSVHLVGHDWGGSVAWSIAREHPSNVRSLTVFSMPEPRALARAFIGVQALKSWYVPLLQSPFIPEWLVHFRNGEIAIAILDCMGLDRKVSERYVRTIAESGQSSGPFNWYRALLLNIGESMSRKPVKPSTVLVWSTGDAAVARKGVFLSTKWAQSIKIVVLDGGTHWIPEEQPRQFSQIVIDHIESVVSR